MIEDLDPDELLVRDVPIIIEPCVQIIEATCAVADSFGGGRVFPIQLYRLTVVGDDVADLPFVPSTSAPHIFSPVTDLRETLVLLVYDHTGRFHTVYKRSAPKNAWNRYPVADETTGRVTTAPSVRFCFQNEKQQKRFLALVDAIIKQETRGVVNCDDVSEFTRVLSRLRVSPVSVPVAVPVRARNSL